MRNLALIQSTGNVVSRWMSEAIKAFLSSPFGRAPKSSFLHPKYPHPAVALLSATACLCAFIPMSSCL